MDSGKVVFVSFIVINMANHFRIFKEKHKHKYLKKFFWGENFALKFNQLLLQTYFSSVYDYNCPDLAYNNGIESISNVNHGCLSGNNALILHASSFRCSCTPNMLFVILQIRSKNSIIESRKGLMVDGKHTMNTLYHLYTTDNLEKRIYTYMYVYDHEDKVAELPRLYGFCLCMFKF